MKRLVVTVILILWSGSVFASNPETGVFTYTGSDEIPIQIRGDKNEVRALVSGDTFEISQILKNGHAIFHFISRNGVEVKYFTEFVLFKSNFDKVLPFLQKDSEIGIGLAVATKKTTTYKPSYKFAGSVTESRLGRFSNEKIRISGQDRFKYVDLSKQFRPEVQKQYGGSCHVYAASALFESFCYRQTGEHLDISEGYLFYRHLRHEINTMESFDSKEQAQTSNGEFTYQDGGTAVFTLKRIAEGDVCSESELPFYVENAKPGRESFSNILADLNDTLEVDENTTVPKKEIVRYLDWAAARSVGEGKVFQMDQDGFRLATNDHKLKDCATRLHAVPDPEDFLGRPEDSFDRAIELLNQGIPFGCSSTYNFGIDPTRVNLDGSPYLHTGRHIATVVGYEFLTDGPRPEVRFLMRDTGYDSMETRVPLDSSDANGQYGDVKIDYCDIITYLE